MKMHNLRDSPLTDGTLTHKEQQDTSALNNHEETRTGKNNTAITVLHRYVSHGISQHITRAHQQSTSVILQLFQLIYMSYIIIATPLLTHSRIFHFAR